MLRLPCIDLCHMTSATMDVSFVHIQGCFNRFGGVCLSVCSWLWKCAVQPPDVCTHFHDLHAIKKTQTSGRWLVSSQTCAAVYIYVCSICMYCVSTLCVLRRTKKICGAQQTSVMKMSLREIGQRIRTWGNFKKVVWQPSVNDEVEERSDKRNTKAVQNISLLP